LGALTDLPDEVTLYRGGTGDPAALAKGFSWSPLPKMAAGYAEKWRTAWRQPGSRVVVKRVVARADILMRLSTCDQETVVAREPDVWSVHTNDTTEIEALARAAIPIW
jgi:hypothetical protein